MNVRDINIRTCLGNTYFDNIYNITVITTNVNINSFIK